MNWLSQRFAAAIPSAPARSVVDWAKAHVKLPGSARSQRYDPGITPWTIKPIECAGDGVTRLVTFVKPVQSGGSVAGEVILCYWLATQAGGDIQYNWQNDEKAFERWYKRIERILRACPPVLARWPQDRRHSQKGLVIFPHCNLTVQGVFSDANVASDSIRFQINEEVHDSDGGWHPGRLQQAYNRTTAFWNSIIFNISNAGHKGDQLYKALHEGTLERWQVKCPGCGQMHTMRTRWDDKRPDLGGLRYDADGCRREDGYDYNKLAPTVRYQMPCGYIVRDDVTERRALSVSGDYSLPENTGAHVSHRSFTLEAVSVDYIPWIKLVMEKHAALKALKYGDPKPWSDYLRERECVFFDNEDRPLMGRIVVNTALKKDRAGLPGRYARFFALDRQQGEFAKGELPHWWLVIRDVLGTGDSQLVFEGKVLTDEDVIDILDRHECVRYHGVADSGDDTTHVYQFCLRYGINAIKGSPEALFSHGEEGRKIFSVEKPLYQMLNAQPAFDDPVAEPQFWFYSKAGIRDRLAWLRSGGAVKWEVPADVSEDYKAHMEAEELQEVRNSRGEPQRVYVQLKRRNDLFVCECYIAMLMDMAGLIGMRISK